jgi:hypothetical protein
LHPGEHGLSEQFQGEGRAKQPLNIAYWFNIVVLAPVVAATMFRLYPIDGGRFAESEGWRKYTASLWFGILALSVFGLFHPLRFSIVLVFQVVQKSLWLLVFVAPRVLRGDLKTLPRGITAMSVLVVVVWPFIIPWGYLLGLGD